MALFRRNKSQAPEPEPDDTLPSMISEPGRKKAGPTPSRKEAEALRRQRVTRQLTPKEARKEAAARNRVERMRNLSAREAQPEKALMRDYVDARFSVGELLIPLMFAVIILTFFPDPLVQTIGLFALWAFFAVAVIDVVMLGFILNRKLAAKFGADKVEKVRWYAAMRALQLRLMRLPKPQVKRGQYPA